MIGGWLDLVAGISDWPINDSVGLGLVPLGSQHWDQSLALSAGLSVRKEA